MKNKSMLRIFALVVVLSMIFTTAAFAMAPNMPPGQYKKMERNMENYEEAARYMKEKGYIKGYGDNVFGFTDLVKRGDIAVMIARSFKLSVMINSLEDHEDEDFFGDVGSEDYFYDAIFAAKKLGIAKGDGKNFNPNKYVTVEEAILMIERSVAVANNNVMEGLEEIYDDLDEISSNLREIFADEMDNFATRQDIALMLYYVLTGEEYDEVKDADDMGYIEYEIDKDEDQFVTFDDESFTDAFDEMDLEDDEELESVRFFLPVKNGTLYYDYDEDDKENELVRENKDYYVGNATDEDLLDKVTFMPKAEFSGTAYIRFLANSTEDNTFYGLVKIKVEGVENEEDEEDEEEFEDLALIKYTMDENNVKEFVGNDLNSNMDEVKFVQPDEDEGTLYFDYNDDGDLKDDNDDEVDEDHFYDDSEFDQVVFVPAQDFTGKVEIEYTAKDGEDSYSGIIRITVKEVQEIKSLELSVEEDDEDFTIDFKDELDDLTEDDEIFTQDVFEDIDTVKFELPDQGELFIDLDNDSKGYIEVEEDEEYDLDDIIELKYVPVDDSDSEDELVKINFTAFDNDKEYNGVIEITVVD